MEERKEIVQFFEENIDQLEGRGGLGSPLSQPHFDLTPRDFLDFAERDLENQNSVHSLVNATSNLKRAVDCQLDTFLALMNLDSFYREKRLGVDRKLGFLEKSGIYRSRSLEKLNRFRNRLEHQYEIPEIEDVEVYFDLVVAFISAIEGMMPLVGNSSQIDMAVSKSGVLSTKFDKASPSIEIRIKPEYNGQEKIYICSMEDNSNPAKSLERLAFFFKVHMALWRFDEGVFSSKHVLKLLNS